MALRNSISARKKGGERRSGRGFSRGELEKAGIGPRQALSFRLAVDVRRRSVHDENVKLAKQQLENSRRVEKQISAKKKKKPAEE